MLHRYHKVATVYARGGEVELALQVFNQGLKINPKDEQIAAELDIIRRQKIKEALDGKVLQHYSLTVPWWK